MNRDKKVMSTKRALVVDDSKSARFAMRKFLEGNGYVVETAESAEEAYIALNKSKPDVIFLDHVMPGVDGLEALSTIKKDTRTASLPVILCSSNEDNNFARQAREFGALDVLLKPPSSQQIAQVLKRLPEVTVAAVERAPAAPPAAPTPSQPPVAAAPTPAPPATPTPAAKVQPIRIPEAAIEQAVLKTLREVLPPTPTSQPQKKLETATNKANAATAASHLGGIPGLQPPAPRTDALREEMERRLQKITQDLYVQLAETRAQLAHLDGELRREPQIRDSVTEVLNEHFGSMTQHFELRLARLRSDFEGLLHEQNRKIEQFNAELQATITAQTQAIAEQVVFRAASSISDQIAESILRALKPAGKSALN